LKILMLTGRFLPTVGGAQVHVEKISSRLRNMGNDVMIIAEKKPLKLRWKEIVNGIMVYRAPIRAFRYILSPTYLFLSIFECLKFNPDMIHAHFAFPPGLVALILGKIFRKPSIVTVHGVDILRDSETKYGMRLNPLLDLAIKFVLKRVTYVIACSKFVRKEVERCGVRKEKVKVINNGIDEIDRKLLLAKSKCQQFRKELDLPNDYKILFTVGRLIPKRGIHYLVRSMKRVAERRSDVLLIVAGDGPQFKELVKMTEKMKLEKTVRFVGEVDNLQLEKMYIASDIVVLPSLIEAFGITVLESMAYMKPLVAFDSGGPSEVISENEIGFVVENRSIDELAEKILELTKSPTLLKEFSSNCQKNIRKYDWDKIADQIRQLYDSLP